MRCPEAGGKEKSDTPELLRRHAARYSGNSWKTSEQRNSHPPKERRGWSDGILATVPCFAASGMWPTVAISGEPMSSRVGGQAREARQQTTASKQTGEEGNRSGDGRRWRQDDDDDDDDSDSGADDGRRRGVTSLSAYRTHSDLRFGTTELRSPEIFVYTPLSIKI